MKTKRRYIPEEEYDALTARLSQIPRINDNGMTAYTSVYMVTGDFEPTQNMNEARWIYIDNPMDHVLFQVDSIGDAIAIFPEWYAN